MKSRKAYNLPPAHDKRDPEHKGETVEEFLKRGGKIKKVEPGICDGIIPPFGKFGTSRNKARNSHA